MAESMYWVATNHAINNVKGNYPEFPKEAKDYQGHRGAITVTYTCGQEEKGDGGGWHEQCYVEFKNKIKLTALKKLFNDRIHWEIRKAKTGEEAAHYALKDMDCLDFPVKEGELRDPDGNSRWRSGTISKVKKGSRTDLEDVKEAILSGQKRKEIATAHFGTYAKYHRGIEAAASAMGVSLEENIPKWVDRECHIFYGPTELGKSLAAERKMDGESFYVPEQNAQGQLSFETYNGEQWIFLDDFEPATLRPGVLKRMMDGRPMVLPGRGANSAKTGRHKGVIITTNWNPQTWVEGPMQDTEWQALQRRCKTVWSCGKTKWTIIGGKQYPMGEQIDAPLPTLLEWVKERNGAGQVDPLEAETEDDEPIDLR